MLNAEPSNLPKTKAIIDEEKMRYEFEVGMVHEIALMFQISLDLVLPFDALLMIKMIVVASSTASIFLQKAKDLFKS